VIKPQRGEKLRAHLKKDDKAFLVYSWKKFLPAGAVVFST
jgi:hypothetical protein